MRPTLRTEQSLPAWIIEQLEREDAPAREPLHIEAPRPRDDDAPANDDRPARGVVIVDI